MFDSLTRLKGVNPIVKCLTKIAVEKCKKKGINAFIVEGKRTKERQLELYGKGRTYSECVKVMSSNKAKKYAKPNESKVTWTLNSKHIDGLAVDVIPQTDKGTLIWDSNNLQTKKLIHIFDDIGFECGAYWTSTPDSPHFQIVLKNNKCKTINKSCYNTKLLKAIQSRLLDLGYYNGKCSGAWNNATITAIKKFKKQKGLIVNENITRKTLKKLWK